MYGKSYYVYIMTNQYRGVLYIGMTNSLLRRIDQHKNKEIDGFSKKYNLTKLVYYEVLDSPGVAIMREKRLKKWNRVWKINLIEKMNPHWYDLYPDLLNS